MHSRKHQTWGTPRLPWCSIRKMFHFCFSWNSEDLTSCLCIETESESQHGGKKGWEMNRQNSDNSNQLLDQRHSRYTSCFAKASALSFLSWVQNSLTDTSRSYGSFDGDVNIYEKFSISYLYTIEIKTVLFSGCSSQVHLCIASDLP